MIVLSELDKRYFKAVGSSWAWNLEFVVFKKGEPQPVGRTVLASFWTRSASIELDLAEGEYVVHVRARVLMWALCVHGV